MHFFCLLVAWIIIFLLSLWGQLPHSEGFCLYLEINAWKDSVTYQGVTYPVSNETRILNLGLSCPKAPPQSTISSYLYSSSVGMRHHSTRFNDLYYYMPRITHYAWEANLVILVICGIDFLRLHTIYNHFSLGICLKMRLQLFCKWSISEVYQYQKKIYYQIFKVCVDKHAAFSLNNS